MKDDSNIKADDTEEKVVPIPIDKIIQNREQHRIIYEDDIKKLAESINKKSQIKPIIVRRVDSKFEPITGQGRIEAHNRIGRKKINAIIRDYKDDEAYEKGLISQLRCGNISSKDHENMVYTRYTNGKKKGRYKSPADFAHKIGISDRNASDLIRAKEDRDKIFGSEGHSDHISTDTLRRIKTLTLSDKKKFCDRIRDDKIKPSDAEEVVKLLKSVSDEISELILDGKFDWRDVKTVIEKRQPVLKAIEDAIASYHKKELIQKIIEDEKPHSSPEPFRLLSVFTNTMSTKYVNNIEDKIQVEQIKRYLRISGTQIFQLLQELKVIDEKQYHTLCDISRIPPEIIHQLKDDGHYYFFKHEWLTPTEKKLKEKMDRILNGKDEPLLR